MGKLKLTQVAQPGGALVIEIAGELDHETAPQLDALIQKAVDAGTSRLVCDLDRTTYISSAGVGLFVGFLNVCREKGGNLVLVRDSAGTANTGIAPGFDPLEVFNLLGLGEVITVAPTVAVALKKL